MGQDQVGLNESLELEHARIGCRGNYVQEIGEEYDRKTYMCMNQMHVKLRYRIFALSIQSGSFSTLLRYTGLFSKRS